MRNIDRFLAELKELNLPLGKYVIVSSGPLAIRDIRECSDLDVLVSDSLFEQFAQNHEVSGDEWFKKISVGNVDLLNKAHAEGDEYPTARQIAEAEMINGFPFQSLETCIFFKTDSGREKDVKDLELIKRYVDSH